MTYETATNPQTGEKAVNIDGKWQVYSESATNSETGQKAYRIGNEWITEDRSVADKAKRAGQVVSKGLLKGAATTVALPLEASERISAPLRRLASRLTGVNLPEKIDVLGGVQQDFGSLYGGIKPETGIERRMGNVAEGVGGGLVFPSGGVAAPLSAGIGAGVSGEMSAAGMPLWQQILGGTLAPLVPGLAASTSKGIISGIKGVSQSADAAFVPGGAERAAGRVATKAATQGKNVKSVQGATAANQEITNVVNSLRKAGAQDDAGLAATKTGNAPFVAMEDVTKWNMSSEGVKETAKREAARKAMLEAITPDEKAAVLARDTAAGPLYQAAFKSTVKVTPELQNIFGRLPKGTMERAAELAKMEGKPFLIGKNVPAGEASTGILDKAGKEIMKATPAQQQKITGESIHYIKRALQEVASGVMPDFKIGSDVQRSAAKLLDEYMGVVGGTADKKGILPIYGQARQVYKQKSAPVNQSQVLKAMQMELQNPKDVGERVLPFLNVLGKGESALLKRSTGYPRTTELSDVLTPEQLSTVNKVADELRTEAMRQTLTKAGRGKALDILHVSEKPGVAPGLVDRTVSIANWALRIMEGTGGKKTEEALALLMRPENKEALALALEHGRPSVKEAIAKEAARRNISLPYAAVGATVGAQ